MVSPGGSRPGTPPPHPSDAAAMWAAYQVSTSAGGPADLPAQGGAAGVCGGGGSGSDARHPDAALASAWAELRADGARMRAAAQTPRQLLQQEQQRRFPPVVPAVTGAAEKGAASVFEDALLALEPSPTAMPVVPGKGTLQAGTVSPLFPTGPQQGQAEGVSVGVPEGPASGESHSGNGICENEEGPQDDERGGLFCALGAHPSDDLYYPFEDPTNPLSMPAALSPIAEAELSNPSDSPIVTRDEASMKESPSGSGNGANTDVLANGGVASTVPPEVASNGTSRIAHASVIGEPVANRADVSDDIFEVPAEVTLSKVGAHCGTIAGSRNDPPGGGGGSDVVEILDLDDPETEAVLEKEAKQIQERKIAERKRRLPEPISAEDVVVVTSADEADQEIIDLSFDTYGAHSYDVNVATAGDFFGAPDPVEETCGGVETFGNFAREYHPIKDGIQTNDFDKSEIKKLVENNNMSADATEEIEDPEVLAVKLLRHQKRAVAWMIKRETRGADPVLSGVDMAAQEVRLDDSDDDSEDDDPSAALSGLVPCLGGILADEQGLGKTLSIIALMVCNPPQLTGEESNATVGSPDSEEASHAAKGAKGIVSEKTRPLWRTLIVCPVSLVSQWKEEIESKIRVEYRPSVYIYHGPKRCRDPAVLSTYDVIITSYTTLTSEYPKVLKGDPMYAVLKKAKQPVPRRPGGPLYQCEWNRAVLDESHYIKNRRTEGWAAAGQLPAERRWCLTGTPIQNSVDDLYSLFCFVRYRFLVKNTYKSWNERWKKKLESSHWPTRKRAFQQFQTIVGVVTLRRTKLDTIEGKPLISLPDRNATVRESQFKTSMERDFYEAVRANSQTELGRLAAKAGGLQHNYSGVMLLLLRLRQACCHPYLIEHASNKSRRHANGAGGTNFVSVYSVQDLDDAQELVESGVSFLGLLAPAARESMFSRLAPPNAGAALPSCPDLYPCDVCFRNLTCGNLRILPAGNFVCRQCAPNILAQLASRQMKDDPFLELDDIRKEVHVRVRSARWLAEDKPAKSSKRARGRRKESKPPVLKKAKNEGGDGDVDVGKRSANGKGSDSDDNVSQEVPERMRAPSTKVMEILEILKVMRERDPSEKCLIFSQWTSMLDIISYHVGAAGFECCRLDGSMPMLKRREQVDRFRSDERMVVFLISMHAGGTGLNLTEANNVILADCWFNPSVEEQCCDRAHRIGQVRPVTITRFKILDTVEEKIYEMCKAKAETCRAALGEGAKSLGRQKITIEDALSLFGDPPEPSNPPPVNTGDAGRRAAAEIDRLLAQFGQVVPGTNAAAGGTI